jgi:cardiolipin synthase
MVIKKHWKLIGIVTAIVFVIFEIVANLRPPQKTIHHQVEIPYGLQDEQFIRAMGHLLGPPIISGNKVQAFYNGHEIFPAMLKAISSAQKTITFESYIYWSGHIGELFAEALSKRAQAGVKVHVLIDWLGSRQIEQSYIDRLKKAGVEIEYYHPLRWYNLSRLNNRTHRKILVIDGKIGFTGGVGISDDWDGDGNDPTKWRDSHFMLEGPAVLYLQAAFMDNWLKIRPEVHHDEKYFPKIPSVGSALAQVFISSPREGSASMQLMYIMAIATAKKVIRISSAYFVPDRLAVEEFIAARKRGVRIQIIVPGPYTDAQIVESASKGLWGELLKAGVEIYEFQPARFHCKVMIVDDLFVSVGSTNFDERSFRLNDEANLNIIDAEFAAHESQTFEKDLAHSKPATLADWEHRPWVEKIDEQLSSLFRSQL